MLRDRGSAVRRNFAAVLVFASLVGGISGCSFAGSPGWPEPANSDPAAIPHATNTPLPNPQDAAGGTWQCAYEPTINNDWHDDVICANGQNSIRPRLLEDERFVTEEEMIAAGQAYEAKLNSQP